MRSSVMGRGSWVRIAAAAALLGACSSEEAPPPFEARVLELTTGDFMVPEGTELQQCVILDPGLERDTMIGRYRAEMLPGSHHFNMFYVDPTTPMISTAPRGVLTDCIDTPARIYFAGSQWETVDQPFPAGVGARIPAGSLLILETHYVNAGDAPSPARLDVKLDEIDPASVVEELGLYFNVMNDIAVPPGTRARLSGRCSVDEGTRIVVMTSHMHHFGERFEINLVDEAAGTTTPLYESLEATQPVLMALWDTPIELGPDQSLEWACTYENPGPGTLVGGGSAETQEMCIMAAFYLPNTRPHPYCFDNATVEPL